MVGACVQSGNGCSRDRYAFSDVPMWCLPCARMSSMCQTITAGSASASNAATRTSEHAKTVAGATQTQKSPAGNRPPLVFFGGPRFGPGPGAGWDRGRAGGRSGASPAARPWDNGHDFRSNGLEFPPGAASGGAPGEGGISRHSTFELKSGQLSPGLAPDLQPAPACHRPRPPARPLALAPPRSLASVIISAGQVRLVEMMTVGGGAKIRRALGPSAC